MQALPIRGKVGDLTLSDSSIATKDWAVVPYVVALTAGPGSHTVYDMTTKRTTRVLTVSVPPEAAEDFERMAEREGRNRSELFREMLGVYRAYLETRTFESLQRYGAAKASHRGVRSEKDVERLLREARA